MLSKPPKRSRVLALLAWSGGGAGPLVGAPSNAPKSRPSSAAEGAAGTCATLARGSAFTGEKGERPGAEEGAGAGAGAGEGEGTAVGSSSSAAKASPMNVLGGLCTGAGAEAAVVKGEKSSSAPIGVEALRAEKLENSRSSSGGSGKVSVGNGSCILAKTLKLSFETSKSPDCPMDSSRTHSSQASKSNAPEEVASQI